VAHARWVKLLGDGWYTIRLNSRNVPGGVSRGFFKVFTQQSTYNSKNFINTIYILIIIQ
jgi:hypothetical protein